MEDLEPFYVFIDSSVIIGNNYQYENPSFRALKDHIKQGRSRILLTDVTIEEIKANIKNDVKTSSSAIKKIRKPAKIIRNLKKYSQSPIFVDINTADVVERLNKQLESLIFETNAEIVTVSDADIKLVFDCYFRNIKPFGPGKKKNEFPDAFILSALSNWAKQHGKKIYLVSHDRDMSGIHENFPGLVSLNKLGEYLKMLTEHYEDLAPLAESLLSKVLAENIREKLRKEFECFGFILSDQWGDVEDVKAIEVDFSHYLISLDYGEGESQVEAAFELSATISYDADISYDNCDSAIWDSEEREPIIWETIEKTVNGSEIIDASVKISFDRAKPHNCKIAELFINSPADVMVTAEEDEWPYK